MFLKKYVKTRTSVNSIPVWLHNFQQCSCQCFIIFPLSQNGWWKLLIPVYQESQIHTKMSGHEFMVYMILVGVFVLEQKSLWWIHTSMSLSSITFLWWYHVNEYRTTWGNWDEPVPVWKLFLTGIMKRLCEGQVRQYNSCLQLSHVTCLCHD